MNNGIALILGFLRNLSRGSHEFFQTPKFVGYLVVRWIWAVKDLYGDGLMRVGSNDKPVREGF